MGSNGGQSSRCTMMRWRTALTRWILGSLSLCRHKRLFLPAGELARSLHYVLSARSWVQCILILILSHSIWVALMQDGKPSVFVHLVYFSLWCRLLCCTSWTSCWRCRSTIHLCHSVAIHCILISYIQWRALSFQDRRPYLSLVFVPPADKKTSINATHVTRGWPRFMSKRAALRRPLLNYLGVFWRRSIPTVVSTPDVAVFVVGLGFCRCCKVSCNAFQ